MAIAAGSEETAQNLPIDEIPEDRRSTPQQAKSALLFFRKSLRNIPKPKRIRARIMKTYSLLSVTISSIKDIP